MLAQNTLSRWIEIQDKKLEKFMILADKCTPFLAPENRSGKDRKETHLDQFRSIRSRQLLAESEAKRKSLGPQQSPHF
jgi:hypothetical protein